jgi:hypothetical protein
LAFAGFRGSVTIAVFNDAAHLPAADRARGTDAMETSLHRQLKERYALPGARIEVRLGCYRIDVVAGDELIEIQHGSLAAIRDKIAALCCEHPVRVVKPIVVRKTLLKLDKKEGRTISRRLSPKVGTIWELFDELVYFTRAFPHPNLTLEVPLVEIEELRYPGHGRRRRWRRNDFEVQDQRLVEVREVHLFQQSTDLLRLLPATLPTPFHTGHLAEALGIRRWIAQRIAYCLRKMAAARECGKVGNALLYEPIAAVAKTARGRKRKSG